MKKRIIAILTCLVILISCILPAEMSTTAYASETGGETWVPGNPETIPLKESDGRIVRWDSVWFGSYPQSEVESTDPVYSALEAETSWDDNGDAIVDGNKYRRIKRSDAVYVGPDGSECYYQWADEDTYHYFKYEPIRWRVLDIDSDSAGNILLLSDVALDNQFYHADAAGDCESVTWETSTIRSWLNGYGSTVNDLGISYESKNFIDTAFSADEKAAISDTNVVNNNNLTTGTAGGNPTTDKVFLLSEEEVYGSSAMSYGFAISPERCDEARKCAASTYAKAMGVFFEKAIYQASPWWLRSPGSGEDVAAYVDYDGMVSRSGQLVDWNFAGVRAALNLDILSLNEVCTNADTVQVESSVPDNKFQVNYYANGGEKAPETQQKEYGISLTLTTEKPTRLGCTFLGWSEDYEAISPTYEAGGEYTEEKDIELYAVWRATVPGDILIVTYNSNGGSKAPESQVKEKGVALTLSAQTPTRTGYTFLGWSSDSKATEPTYEAGGTYTEDQSTTLYAVWKKDEEKKTIQVTYNANGGSNAPTSQEKQEGIDLTLSNKMPTRTGYTFLGWSSDSKATEPTYEAGGTYTEDADITLYAVWKKKVVVSGLENPRIEKHANDNGRKVTWDCVQFGSYPQSEVTSSDPVYDLLEEETDWDANNDAVVEGNKYRRMKKGDATYAEDGGVFYYNWDDSVTYHYFKYEPVKWRVLSIDEDTNEALILSDLVLDNRLYHDDETEVTWKTSMMRSWLNGYDGQQNCMEISYKDKGFIDTAFSSGEKAAISSTDLKNTETGDSTAEEYATADKVFLLSEPEASGEEGMAYGFALSGSANDDMRFGVASTYAKAMGVCFDQEDDTCHWWLRLLESSDTNGYVTDFGNVRYSEFDIGYDYGVRAALKLDLSSNTWSKAGTKEADSKENGDVSSIEYNTIDGTGVPASQIKQYGVPLTLSNQIPKRNGYTFLGWSEDVDATVPSYEAGGVYTGNRDLRLWAVWTVRITKVTYHANGGTGAPGPQEKNFGVTLTLSKQKPTRAGYTFLGWSADSKATTPSYNLGGEYTIDEDITLYAVWGKANTTQVKVPQSITTSAYSYTKPYGSKSFSLGARANGGGKLTYSSSNKKVATVSASGKVSVKKYGAAKITIKAAATQSYLSASKTVTVKVVPKKVTLKSVKSPSSKMMIVSWKKNKDATGYRVMISQKKNFTRGTFKREYKKVTSGTIRHWKSKTKCYVRVQAYKKVGKTKYYGAWSNVKSVRVK